MKSNLCAALFALALLTSPATAAMAGTATGHARGSSLPADELRAKFDPRLGSLRAGRVDDRASLNQDERATLLTAQDRSTGLAEMRAGGVESALVIVVLVLLILVLL